MEHPMARAIVVEAKHTAGEPRALARAEVKARPHMRMLAVAETIEGADRATAGRRSDMSDQAVVDAIKRYNAEGIAGLYDRPRSGRPAKLDDDRLEQLRDIAVAGPDVEAEGVSAYTRDDLCAIAEKTWGVGVAVTSMGRILRDMGLSRQ
jgi:transposase